MDSTLCRSFRLYGKTANIGRQLCNKYQALFEKYDVLVMPMSRIVAPGDGQRGLPLESIKPSRGSTVNTAIFNVTGHTAISIPVVFVSASEGGDSCSQWICRFLVGYGMKRKPCELRMPGRVISIGRRCNLTPARIRYGGKKWNAVHSWRPQMESQCASTRNPLAQDSMFTLQDCLLI